MGASSSLGFTVAGLGKLGESFPTGSVRARSARASTGSGACVPNLCWAARGADDQKGNSKPERQW